MKIVSSSLKIKLNQVWCHTPVILEIIRIRQEGTEFKDSLGYTGRPCLKK
jgi:hypothetical protein